MVAMLAVCWTCCPAARARSAMALRQLGVTVAVVVCAVSDELDEDVPGGEVLGNSPDCHRCDPRGV
jgi:hypothetical protein